MIRYLTKAQIVFLNKETIRIHGGNYISPYNFLYEENLDYLIESVSAELFGSSMYPYLSDKATLYCHHIICNHIFSDGNKRTGLAAALQFLNLNGSTLSDSVDNKMLTDFIFSIASGAVNLEDCRLWFDKNVEGN